MRKRRSDHEPIDERQFEASARAPLWRDVILGVGFFVFCIVVGIKTWEWVAVLLLSLLALFTYAIFRHVTQRSPRNPRRKRIP